MRLTSLFAAETGHTTGHAAELPAPPLVIGLVALAILMALLVGILMFGKGRPHS